MIKIIMIPIFTALLTGWGGAYFLSSFEKQESFRKNKEKIEENATNRREKICEEIEALTPGNPELARLAVQSEIDEMDKRKTVRWQK